MTRHNDETVKISISLRRSTLADLAVLEEHYKLSRSGTITQLVREALAKLPEDAKARAKHGAAAGQGKKAILRAGQDSSTQDTD